MNIFEITVRDYLGIDTKLDTFKGKVLLIVNTATKCGHTPQYDGLQALYSKYKDKGLEILDFPCNQFFGQAPQDIGEINNICTLQFNTTFWRGDKIEVNGKNQTELYKVLKANSQDKSAIKWNFTKFLVSRDGKTVIRFEPKVQPIDLEEDIKKLLEE